MGTFSFLFLSLKYNTMEQYVVFVQIIFHFSEFSFTTPFEIQFVCKCSLAFNAADIAVFHFCICMRV